jgi:hypothetical protein
VSRGGGDLAATGAENPELQQGRQPHHLSPPHHVRHGSLATEAREVQRRLRAAPSELCEAAGGSSWSVEGRSASWNDCRLGTGTTSQKLSSSYRNPMVKDEPELHRGSDQG